MQVNDIETAPTFSSGRGSVPLLDQDRVLLKQPGPHNYPEIGVIWIVTICANLGSVQGTLDTSIYYPAPVSPLDTICGNLRFSGGTWKV